MSFDTLMGLIAIGLICFVFGWGTASILGALVDLGRSWWRTRH